MARIIQDEATLQLCGKIDTGNLCVTGLIDEDNLCVTGLIDEANLCTDIGETTAAFYRADTTVLTADIDTISADYHY